MTEADQRTTLLQAAPEPFDPYKLSPDAVADPPSTFFKCIRQIGPGLILAGSIVGTGELVATTHTGAKVGFALLWLVITSCFIKVFVQVELGRYAISSGQTTLGAFRQLPFGGQFVGWWWLLMMLSTQFQLGAMVGGVGQAAHMMVPGTSPWLAEKLASLSPSLSAAINSQPVLPWAVLVAVATSILLAAGGYALIEKGSTFLVVLFTLTTVLCVALLPAAGHPIGWSNVAGGLRPSIPDAATLGAAFAMFGITGVGAAELVAYPYWCIEKGYARRTGPRDDSPGWAERARGWLRVMRVDAWLSMVIYTVATVAFFFLGASVLHDRTGKGLPQKIDQLLVTLAQMYEPVMGARLSLWFIVAGAFAVLYSTLYSATAANSRASADFLRTHIGLTFTTPADRTRWVRVFCILFPIIDLVLFLAVGNAVTMVLIGGFTQALTLPILAVAALYLRYQRTDKRLAPGKIWDIFLWLSMLGMLLAASYMFYDFWQKFIAWLKPS